MAQTKLLIIDENVAYRDIFQELLTDVKDISVVGTAPSAKIGLDKCSHFKPSVILASAHLTDIPIKDLTQKILELSSDTGVIVTIDPNDSHGAMKVIESLEKGAFDFLQKIPTRETDKNRERLKQKLVSKIRCFSIENFSRKAKILSADPSRPTVSKPATGIKKNKDLSKLGEKGASQSSRNPEAVLIGVSTLGPKALNTIIPSIPASFPVPIIIVLHMPKSFTRAMADELNRRSPLTVQESGDGTECRKGYIYLAQGGIHLTVERGTRNRIVLKTVDSAPENGCKPSVDVLFRSAASVYKGRVLPIILTGMGTDGTKGLAELKKDSVHVIAQDKSSSVVWGMPGNAVKAGYVDEILPLHKIAKRIIELI